MCAVIGRDVHNALDAPYIKYEVLKDLFNP